MLLLAFMLLLVPMLCSCHGPVYHVDDGITEKYPSSSFRHQPQSDIAKHQTFRHCRALKLFTKPDIVGLDKFTCEWRDLTIKLNFLERQFWQG